MPKTAVAVTLLVLSLILYANTLGNGFVFDDKLIIERNPNVRTLEGIPKLFVTPYWADETRANRLYRPLTTMTFALNYLVGGENPAGFHFFNALLHGLVAVAIFSLLVALWGRGYLAVVAALLFTVHPVVSEAVAGLVGRAELLSALWLLLALRLDREGSDRWGAARGWVHLASLLCFLLALLSKENALALPLVMILTDLTRGKPVGLTAARRRVEWGTTLAVAAVYLGLRYLVLGNLMEPGGIAEVDNPLAHTSTLTRILTAVALTAKYLALFLVPVRLSVDYSAPQIPAVASVWEPRLWLGSAVVAGFAILFTLSYRKNRPLAWSLGFAAITFLIVSNLLFPIGTIFAERFLYLPLIGLCTSVGCFAVLLAQKRPRTVSGVVAVALILLAGRTWTRNRDWRNDFTLFRSAARVSARSAKVRYNLGNAHRRQGQLAQAAHEYRTCLQLFPAFEPARRNLGVTLVDLGRAEEAIVYLEEAVSRAPRSSSIHNNLGNAYREAGREEEAEREYRRAMEIDPASADPHNNLALLHQARGEMDRAEGEYREAVSLEPERISLRVNLGNFLILRGDFLEAERVFREATVLNPSRSEPHRGLGEALLRQGRLEEAEQELRRSLNLDTHQWESPALLGYLYQMRGEVEEAVRFYQDSLQRNPNQFELHRNLGILYLKSRGEQSLALGHLERALALEPPEAVADEIRRLLRTLDAESRAP